MKNIMLSILGVLIGLSLTTESFARPSLANPMNQVTPNPQEPIAYHTLCAPPVTPSQVYSTAKGLNNEQLVKGAICVSYKNKERRIPIDLAPCTHSNGMIRGKVITQPILVATPCPPGSTNCWQRMNAKFCQYEN